MDAGKRKKFEEESKKEFDEKDPDHDSKAEALALAKTITEGADDVDLPVAELLAELQFLKAMKGVHGFKATPVGPGVWDIYMNPPVKKGYTTGEYKDVGGHHVHSKAGFKDHPTYDKDKGFSIGQEYMEEHGLSHRAMTTKQRELFKELAESGRPNTLAEHTRIAKESLIAGGASEELAASLVNESLLNLSKQGIISPTHIPWQKIRNK